MKEVKINPAQVAWIRIYKKAEDFSWKYFPEKKYWFYTRKAGFRLRPDFNGIWSAEQIEASGEGVFVEGEKVYFYPHVELHMVDSCKHTKWFKTEEQLNDFLFNYGHINWITK
jgi:hypothetical protein